MLVWIPSGVDVLLVPIFSPSLDEESNLEFDSRLRSGEHDSRGVFVSLDKELSGAARKIVGHYLGPFVVVGDNQVHFLTVDKSKVCVRAVELLGSVEEGAV